MCEVEWCTNKPHPSGKGYCRRHYDQRRKFGRILEKRSKSDPNEIVICEGHAEVVLRNAVGEEVGRTLIDLEDVERVRRYKWSMNDNGYVRCVMDGRTTYLHRWLVGADAGQEIDHINLNKLDNRKKNLRFCEHVQNCWNRRSDKRGVRRVKGRKLAKPYCAVIMVNGSTKHLGYFKTQAEALAAREAAERKYFGEFRCVI